MLGRGQPRLEILVITAWVQPAASARRPIWFQVKISWTWLVGVWIKVVVMLVYVSLTILTHLWTNFQLDLIKISLIHAKTAKLVINLNNKNF